MVYQVCRTGLLLQCWWKSLTIEERNDSNTDINECIGGIISEWSVDGDEMVMAMMKMMMIDSEWYNGNDDDDVCWMIDGLKNLSIEPSHQQGIWMSVILFLCNCFSFIFHVESTKKKETKEINNYIHRENK